MAQPSQTTDADSSVRQANQRLDLIRKAIADEMYDQALAALETWIKEAPQIGMLPLTQGQCLLRMGNLSAAIAPLERASELMPKRPEPLQGLANIARRQHRQADEAQALKRLLALDSANVRIASRLFELQEELGDHAGMLETADQYLPAPQTAEVRLSRTRALTSLGRTLDARKEVEAMLDDPACFDVGVGVLHTHLESEEDLNAAVSRLRQRAEDGNESPALWMSVGRLHSKLEQIPPAIAALERSLELDPRQVSAWHDLGVLQRQEGAVEESQRSLEKCLEIDPFNASALRIVGYEHKFEYGSPLFKIVTHATARLHDYPEAARPQVHFAMAKALEDVGDLDSAFAHYFRGGQLQKIISPWQDSRMRNVLSVMQRYLKADDYLEAAKQGVPGPKPVFVFGMPRSGTTLLEQVIASHPLAHGAGELKLASGVINNIKIGRVLIETLHEGAEKGPRFNARQWTIAQRGERYLAEVEKLAGPEAQRIVDKMPGNYHWLGPLSVILPDCHLIHSRRHPVEICLSEYRIFFPDGIPFSYDLRDLGKAYRMYVDYMAYWHSVLPPGRVLHVRYEDMVADLETQARRILAHIGLPWDDACLKFYETKRKVKTASVTQVRRPIYTTSTNRWRKYEAYLKPLLEELGPLVAQYEAELEKAEAEGA